MSWSQKRLSKFISLVLRHRPQGVGLRLEPGGWARIDELVRKGREAAGAPLTRERIHSLVEEQKEPRFSLNADGDRIRAIYGHSLDVDLGLEPAEPPNRLYHGTASRTVDAILREGIDARSRRHVHLSIHPESASKIGRRHGSPRVLQLEAVQMHRDHHLFYHPADKIWLTRRVPPRYLKLIHP